MNTSRFTRLIPIQHKDAGDSSRVVWFQMTERFLDGTQDLLGETIPNAAEAVAVLPGETTGGVAEAAQEVGKAVGSLLKGMGSAAGEGIRPVVHAVEDTLVTAATPLNGVKKIVWDTPVSLVNEGPWAATKNLLNGAIWQPLRTVGNACKTVINAGTGLVQAGARGTGELMGVDVSGEGAGTNGKGVMGALSHLATGVKSLFKGIGESTVAKKMGALFGGISRWRWPLSVTGEGNTKAPPLFNRNASVSEQVDDVAEELAEAA